MVARTAGSRATTQIDSPDIPARGVRILVVGRVIPTRVGRIVRLSSSSGTWRGDPHASGADYVPVHNAVAGGRVIPTLVGRISSRPVMRLRHSGDPHASVADDDRRATVVVPLGVIPTRVGRIGR